MSDSWQVHSRDFGLRLLTALLTLWTPFYFLSAYRGHPISIQALGLSALLFLLFAAIGALAMGRQKGLRRVLVIAALVSLFLDLNTQWFNGLIAYTGMLLLAAGCWIVREHIEVIVISMLAAMLVSSLFTDNSMGYEEQTRIANPDATPPKPAAGRVVHLILDEFTGLAGIPQTMAGGAELRQQVDDFFSDYGLSVYPGAISEYVSTKASIPGMMNFTASADPQAYYHSKQPYVIQRNAYFESLFSRGFSINILQSTYLDFCSESPVPVAICRSYRYDGTDWLRSAELSDIDQAGILLGIFLNHPDALEPLWKIFIRLGEYAGRIGLPWPDSMSWNGHISSLAAASTLPTLRQMLHSQEPGQAYIAHLLMPHSPYTYTSDCSLRPDPLSWLSHLPLHHKTNTAAQRQERYQLYFDQIQCTLKQLRPVMQDLASHPLWASTELIVHGDHGSRIYETAPRAGSIAALSQTDLRDAYSTLFAVKSARSHTLSKYTPESPLPVSLLLAELAGNGATTADAERPVVYAQGRGNDSWIPIDWQ